MGEGVFVTEFHERPFAQRWGAMGDAAEQAFLELYPKAHRLGLDRTSLRVDKMPQHARYTPDFLVENGAVEVMGFSSRGNNALKVKCEKLESLIVWEALMPTALWVRDSATKRVWIAQPTVWAQACYRHAERLHFPDNGRAYWNLKRADFPECEAFHAAA